MLLSMTDRLVPIESVAPVMLTPEQAARRLGVSSRSLARWSREGLIKTVVLPSGHRRYRVEDIDALTESKIGRASA